jgi:hypothetical protein
VSVARCLPLLCALLGLSCAAAEGEGEVTSDRLYVEDCWNGPFDLNPNFFAANPFREDALQIRIQAGDDIQELSDGLTVLVNDLQELRGRLGQDIEVGVPPGVSPPGVPLQADLDPPQVSLALYLHKTCHTEIGTVYSVEGTIRFESLFSGDLNEGSSEDRLTEGSFTAKFGDPRQLAPGSEADPALVTSDVIGNFRFFFQRGQPSQPFN